MSSPRCRARRMRGPCARPGNASWTRSRACACRRSPSSIGRGLVLRTAEKILRQRVPDDMPAPFEALAAVRAGLSHGIAAGLLREREAIGRLATTTACRNMITLFFLIERARKAEGDSKAE